MCDLFSKLMLDCSNGLITGAKGWNLSVLLVISDRILFAKQ